MVVKQSSALYLYIWIINFCGLGWASRVRIPSTLQFFDQLARSTKERPKLERSRKHDGLERSRKRDGLKKVRRWPDSDTEETKVDQKWDLVLNKTGLDQFQDCCKAKATNVL